MTASVVSLVAVVGALVLALVIVLQPTTAWRQAAEHSKQFWGAWVLGLVAIALVAPGVEGVSWATAVWTLACCAFAVLQPSLFGDVREVRAHLRGVAAHPDAPVPPSRLPAQPVVTVAHDEPPPIRWRASGR